MRNLKSVFVNLVRDESGAAATEYALLIVFIAIVAATGMLVLGNGLNTLFANIGDAVAAANLAPLPAPPAPAPVP